MQKKELREVMLRKKFLIAAKAQKSLNDDVYTIDFDGTNANIVFKESGLGNDPVDTVKKEAEKMLDEIFKVVDELEVIIEGKTVKVTKDNIGELAQLFLGNTVVDEFLSNGNITRDFSVKISKDGISTEIKELKSKFTLEKDEGKRAEELKNSFLDKAKAQKSLNDDVYTIDFDGTNANIVFKESGLDDGKAIDTIKGQAGEMLDEIFKVVDELEVIIEEKTVKVTKDNIGELAQLFLGNTVVDEFLSNGNITRDFSVKISKDGINTEIKDLKSNFTLEKDVNK